LERQPHKAEIIRRTSHQIVGQAHRLPFVLALEPKQHKVFDMDSSTQNTVVAKFRTLHKSGCFVLPNPWDIGTAVYLESLGFEALATTSAGFAFSRGKPDGGVPRDEMVAHIREIVEATTLPVNADFLGGYADEPEGVAANVRLCIATGVAGLSIEDNTGRKEMPLYQKKLAVERIRAARSAIDASGNSVVLTGRCEAWLVDDADPLHTALDRLAAYAEAGADCLYAPGVTKSDEISQIVKTVAPKPVNVLVSGFNHQLSLSQLADLGVRRISVGSGLALAAWGTFLRAAKDIHANGTFNLLADGAKTADLNELFREKC
jgi:2-methylisocitrate lyase-like PEP mutase family enzyme